MSRYLILLLFLGRFATTSAQFLHLPYDGRVDLNTGYRNTISVNGSFDYNANTVHNELPLAIWRGGYLDPAVREGSAEGLLATGNTAGYVVQGRLHWTGATCLKALPRWRPHVGIAHHELGGVSFTRDQYELGFFGNAEYEGSTAVLGPSRYEQISFQTIGIGLEHAETRSQVRLDLVRGRSFATAEIQQADLFTGEDGRVLRSVLVGDYYASDTSDGGHDRTNGLGAAVSGRWNFSTGKGSGPTRITLAIEEFGFIAWNENTVRILKDTLIEYSGWEVENLFALDDVIIGEETLLDTFGLRYRTGPVTRLLPFRTSVEGHMPLGAGTWQVGLCAEYRYLAGYTPQFTALVTRRMGQRTQLGGDLSYGGAGALRFGMAAKQRFGDRVLVTLSTPQVPAFFSGSVKGLGLAFGLSVGF